MGDAAKARKSPEPRGLSVTLPLEQSAEVHDLAQMAGHSTKAQVEAELVEWLVVEGLNFFRARLANRAQERLNKIKAPTDAAQTMHDMLDRRAGLTPDGGIPLVGADEALPFNKRGAV